ncbi:hypothetical protein T492DRAFT_1121751 [Pavlovales sp. CCMP2436]|nr:hypothetical protein T492DRAFT_1121751 [Pavlovales sp. CCMP2436]
MPLMPFVTFFDNTPGDVRHIDAPSTRPLDALAPAFKPAMRVLVKVVFNLHQPSPNLHHPPIHPAESIERRCDDIETAIRSQSFFFLCTYPCDYEREGAMHTCHTCGVETERAMLNKYCKFCYEKLKRAVDHGCGMPELHGHDKIRRCPVCTSHANLSSNCSELPKRKRFVELYLKNPTCAVTGYAFRPVTDPVLLLPTPAKRNQGLEHTEDNLVFVTRFVGNAMRNGHATLAQTQEAMGVLAVPSATVSYHVERGPKP